MQRTEKILKETKVMTVGSLISDLNILCRESGILDFDTPILVLGKDQYTKLRLVPTLFNDGKDVGIGLFIGEE